MMLKDIYTCAIALGNKKAAIGQYFPQHSMFDNSFLERNIETVEVCKRCILKFMCGGGCANGIISKYGDVNHANCKYINYELYHILPKLYKKLKL